MITTLRTGFYKLIETTHHIKVLYLDNDVFAWVEPKNIGEILISSRRAHKTDCLLSMGRYHVYDVQDEAHLSDQIHLELEAGKNVWQGYLLLSGLPNAHHKRGRIIPTHEIITGNPKFRYYDLYTRLAAEANLHW